MRVPLSWLREYVETSASARDLARRLSISALEVDRVDDVGVADVDGNLGRFVVGRVLAADPHPNADRLQLCQVDVGNPDPQQIVCGAWNFGVGATVAVGLPGALLPGFPGPLEERKLRGEVSRGMILAEDEVGLGPDHSGIMLLPASVEPGTPLADVLPLADQVLDVTPTMNRARPPLAGRDRPRGRGALRRDAAPARTGRSPGDRSRARSRSGSTTSAAARGTSPAGSAALRSGRRPSGSVRASTSRACARSPTSST